MILNGGGFRYHVRCQRAFFTSSAYTAPKEGKIFYNKTMYDKYGKAEGMVLDSLKNFDEEIDISSLNVPRSDAAEFF